MYAFNPIVVAVTPVVFFDHSMYGVEEKTGLVQLVLFLSQPWPVDFTVQVIDHSLTATGKLSYC